MTGRAAIDCTLSDDGALRSCQIVEETPARYDFGEAALKIACRIPANAFSNTNANNTPYVDETGQRRVRRTVRFEIAGESEPPHGSINNQ